MKVNSSRPSNVSASDNTPPSSRPPQRQYRRAAPALAHSSAALLADLAVEHHVRVDALHIALEVVTHRNQASRLQADDERRALLHLFLQLLVVGYPFGGVVFRGGGQRQLAQRRDLPVGAPGQRLAAVFRVVGEGCGIGVRVEIIRPRESASHRS